MLRRLLRYPVKSAAGEELDRVAIGPDGLAGDRRWAALDGDGVVVSAKHPRRWGRLLEVGAKGTDADGADGAGEPGEVMVEVPGFPPAPAGSAAADAALSAWLGATVRLTRTVPERAQLWRVWPSEAGVLADWVDAEPGTEAVTPITGARPGGRFLDAGVVHLLTTAALAALAGLGPDADPRRFRANLVLDLPREPEPGDVVAVGEVVLRVTTPTARCVVPALPQVGLPADTGVLGTLARHHRVTVPGRGRAACFGHYAEVLRPGTVATGDSAGYA